MLRWLLDLLGVRVILVKLTPGCVGFSLAIKSRVQRSQRISPLHCVFINLIFSSLCCILLLCKRCLVCVIIFEAVDFMCRFLHQAIYGSRWHMFRWHIQRCIQPDRESSMLIIKWRSHCFMPVDGHTCRCAAEYGASHGLSLSLHVEQSSIIWLDNVLRSCLAHFKIPGVTELRCHREEPALSFGGLHATNCWRIVSVGGVFLAWLEPKSRLRVLSRCLESRV